jgi:hypothetical protein
MFSWTCSTGDAPVITVDTSGFAAHQAMASWARVQPRSSAMSASRPDLGVGLLVGQVVRRSHS